MGKSARSNKKKQTRTVRRARLESTKWVQEADKKRLEVLAQCVEAPAPPVINSLPKGAAENDNSSDDGGMDTEEDKAPASRGRPGKPKKPVAVPILPVPLPSSAMEAEGGGKKTKGGKKGKVNGAVGVTKKQAAKKKVSVLWVSEFHKKHGSKKRR